MLRTVPSLLARQNKPCSMRTDWITISTIRTVAMAHLLSNWHLNDLLCLLSLLCRSIAPRSTELEIRTFHVSKLGSAHYCGFRSKSCSFPIISNVMHTRETVLKCSSVLVWPATEVGSNEDYFWRVYFWKLTCFCKSRSLKFPLDQLIVCDILLLLTVVNK